MKIAIVGHGFVGQAVDYGFAKAERFYIDPKHGTTMVDVSASTDVIFICVPTPMGFDARIDPTILMNVINDIRHLGLQDKLVIIKSTVTPDIVETVANLLPRFVYNPEFLTERNANEDFVNPPMHVFGSHNPVALDEIEDLYMRWSTCRKAPMVRVDPKAASLIKYSINSFLMTKVIFYNQLRNVIEESGTGSSYEEIVEALQNDERMGYSHMQVPGPDGKFGAGGKCLTKDPNAFVQYAKSLGVPFTQLSESIYINECVRPDVYNDGARSIG